MIKFEDYLVQKVEPMQSVSRRNTNEWQIWKESPPLTPRRLYFATLKIEVYERLFKELVVERFPKEQRK